MTRIMELLKEEHAVFRGVLRRIETNLGRSEGQLKPLLIRSLKFLLPALRRHEEIEHGLFAGLLGPQDRDLLRTIGLQHDALEGLCKDMQLMLKHGGEYSFDHLRTLAGLLIRSLSEHLCLEERRLWPRMRRRSAKAGLAGRGAHFERLVRRLEATA